MTVTRERVDKGSSHTACRTYRALISQFLLPVVMFHQFRGAMPDQQQFLYCATVSEIRLTYLIATQNMFPPTLLNLPSPLPPLHSFFLFFITPFRLTFSVHSVPDFLFLPSPISCFISLFSSVSSLPRPPSLLH